MLSMKRYNDIDSHSQLANDIDFHSQLEILDITMGNYEASKILDITIAAESQLNKVKQADKKCPRQLNQTG